MILTFTDSAEMWRNPASRLGFTHSRVPMKKTTKALLGLILLVSVALNVVAQQPKRYDDPIPAVLARSKHLFVGILRADGSVDAVVYLYSSPEDRQARDSV